MFNKKCKKMFIRCTRTALTNVWRGCNRLRSPMGKDCCKLHFPMVEGLLQTVLTVDGYAVTLTQTAPSDGARPLIPRSPTLEGLL